MMIRPSTASPDSVGRLMHMAVGYAGQLNVVDAEECDQLGSFVKTASMPLTLALRSHGHVAHCLPAAVNKCGFIIIIIIAMVT